ncbi:Uncharacterized protein FKW44_009670 [Caligus rogercresseyi]|uniref:Uncharacterized protein n=1 Tax=Caligus rogercresseyi TaxID=217165 RepID=A0A7T8K7I5_CALRO|nr:Uncharacterized protein FKW44_009670 [Caligus rogercresseyi]
MADMRPAPTNFHGKPQANVPRSLAHTSHVFVRNNTVRPPLTKPYDGPFEVVERFPKYFTLQLGTERKNVSIDRLKPAHTPQDFRPRHSTHQPFWDEPDMILDPEPNLPTKMMTSRGLDQEG